MRLPPSLKQSALALAALGIAFGMAGCTATPMSRTLAAMPPDYRDRHPILLAQTTQTTPIDVAVRGGIVSGLQRAEVESFARAYKADGEGTILVAVPAGTANAPAAVKVAGELREILTQSGITPATIAIHSYRADPSLLAPPINLSYTRLRAAVPHRCAMNGDGDANAFNQDWENLGCAVQTNLAAVVADPHDLSGPRPMDPAYAARRYKVLDKHRDGSDTTTQYANQARGSVSNVGQQ